MAAGHPLDLIKVNIQTMETPQPGQKPMYSGTLDCARQIIAKDGVRSNGNEVTPAASCIDSLMY